MKYIITSVCLIAFLVAPCISRAQALTIAYVDVQKVMIESEQGKQIRKLLTDDAERIKKNLEAKQDELQKLKDTLEKQGATITPEARAEKEKQYQSKVKDFQRVYSDYESEMKQKDMEYSQKILRQIEEVVRAIGEKEKYSFILERSQAGILFATSSADITAKVITLFNENSVKTKQPVSGNSKPATKTPTKK